MDQYLKTLGKVALIAACAAIPLALAGCEKDETRADKRVKQNIAQSSQVAVGGKTAVDADKNQKEAVKLLADAAKESGASSLNRAAAKALLAEANYAHALSLLPQLSDNERQVLNLIDQIDRLGVGIAGDNRLVAQYAGANPAGKGEVAPLAAFENNKKQAAVKVAEAKKLIAATQTGLTAKEAVVDGLEAKRGEAAKQAAQLLLQSEKAAGRESVDLYNNHLVARKQAADLARDRGVAQLQVVGLKTTIAEAQKQKTIAQEAIVQADGQIAQLQVAWVNTQKAMAERRAAAKAMVTQAKLAEKVADLSRLLGAAADLRKEVADKYIEAAINNYADAARDANTFKTEIVEKVRNSNLQQSPSKQVWDKLSKSYGPAPYKLAKVRALQLRGNLYLNQKLLLDSLQQAVGGITPAFKAAGLVVPTELTALVKPVVVAEAAKKAKQDIEVADEDLREMAQSDNVSVVPLAEKAEASVGHVVAQHSLYRLTGDNKYLAEAKEQLKLIVEAGVINLPALPEVLEEGVVKRTGITLAVSAAATPGMVEKNTAPTSQPAGPVGGGGGLGGLLKQVGDAFKTGPQTNGK